MERVQREDGYVDVKTDDGTWNVEHRVKMEEHLGRKLERSEVVHHINGDRSDNRISNLEVMDAREHARKHGEQQGVLIAVFECPQCAEEFERERRQTFIVKKDQKACFCSKSCAAKHAFSENTLTREEAMKYHKRTYKKYPN